jgi:hypothetical protein
MVSASGGRRFAAANAYTRPRRDSRRRYRPLKSSQYPIPPMPDTALLPGGLCEQIELRRRALTAKTKSRFSTFRPS